jgi:hypothetical protein
MNNIFHKHDYNFLVIVHHKEFFLIQYFGNWLCLHNQVAEEKVSYSGGLIK